MRRQTLILLSAFAIMFFLAGALPALADGEQPPDIERGWNLISTPCDISVADVRQKLGNDGISVFDWDGTQYVQVETLERGRGYMLNSNAVLSTSSICGEETGLPEGFSKTFRAGWNLIGNPYHKAVIFENILGSAASAIGNNIYEYQGNKISQVALSDHMKVFRGYWIYTRNEVAITFEESQSVPACDSLSVGFADSSITKVTVGDTVALAAKCIKGDSSTDVTSSAAWSLDSEQALAATAAAGMYAAIAEGTAVVTAQYEGFTGSTNVTVQKKTEKNLVSISVMPGLVEMPLGVKSEIYAWGEYSDGSMADITLLVEYTLSDTTVGELLRETIPAPCSDPSICGTGSQVINFRALKGGSTDITAKLGDIVSEPVTVTVLQGDTLSSIFISPDTAHLEPHETTLLHAYAAYSPSGRYEDVTAQVEWTISPPDAAAIEQSTGRLTPLKIGNFGVSAKYQGTTSEIVRFEVIPKTLRWIGIYGFDGIMQLPCPNDPRHQWCYNNWSARLGTSGGKLMAFGEYSDDTAKWIPSSDFTWEVSNPSVLEVDSTGAIAIKAAGLSGVRGYKDGVYSEWAWIYVYTDSTNEFLMLEYSNQEVIVEKGKSINIGATYYKFDSSRGIFTSSNVTEKAVWSLGNASTGSISKGIFTGSAVGETTVSATYGALNSNSATLRVWAPSHLTYCDESNINDQEWQDGLSVASLESDCKTYSQSDTINVRFLAQLLPDVDRRVLDTCLDLYIYDSNQKLVRTFQHRDCSPTPLFRTIAGATPVYDYSAAWDQKDDDGNKVPAGEYTAVARYYILYCPVLKVKFTIN